MIRICSEVWNSDVGELFFNQSNNSDSHHVTILYLNHHSQFNQHFIWQMFGICVFITHNKNKSTKFLKNSKLFESWGLPVSVLEQFNNSDKIFLGLNFIIRGFKLLTNIYYGIRHNFFHDILHFTLYMFIFSK